MNVNVRSVGVGRVGVCIMCTSVNEEGGGREEFKEYGLRRSISVVIHTWIRQSHGLGQTLPVWVLSLIDKARAKEKTYICVSVL